MQQILSAQKPTHLSHPGARFSVPGGMAMAGAAAAAFGTMGVGAFAPPYPLAFHRLAQTYMHAIWRQGLYHHSSASSPSSSSSATSATVSVQAWNTTAATPCGPFPAVSHSGASTSGDRTSKRTMTPAERMREYREKLKRNPEVYQRYKQMNALRSRLARMRRSQEQVQKDREKARIRNLRYRSRLLPDGMDLMAFAAETSALDFSNAGPATPPSASDTERSLAPSSPSSDWEPPVSFGDPPAS